MGVELVICVLGDFGLVIYNMYGLIEVVFVIIVGFKDL